MSSNGGLLVCLQCQTRSFQGYVPLILGLVPGGGPLFSEDPQKTCKSLRRSFANPGTTLNIGKSIENRTSSECPSHLRQSETTVSTRKSDCQASS